MHNAAGFKDWKREEKGRDSPAYQKDYYDISNKLNAEDILIIICNEEMTLFFGLPWKQG